MPFSRGRCDSSRPNLQGCLARPPFLKEFLSCSRTACSQWAQNIPPDQNPLSVPQGPQTSIARNRNGCRGCQFGPPAGAASCHFLKTLGCMFYGFASSAALALSLVSATKFKDSPRAQNSPNESQRRCPSSINC